MTSRGSRLLVPAVAVALAVLGPALPAAADDPVDVPGTATITLRGDGSGHGRGMSQYGAYSAARAPHSLTSTEILDFYYPGTDPGSAGGRVKVWIRGDGDRDLVVRARDGLTIGKVGGRTWRPRVPRVRSWRVRWSRSGDHVVSYRTARWHTWRVVDGDVALAAGGRPLTLLTRGGAVSYRGSLRSVDFQGTQRLTVNVLPMEQYVRGVVPAEMQAGWPQHALRAQAVAARTYATHERGDGNTYYDLCDTDACQAYGGASAETRATTRATTATAGDVLTYGGETAFAEYSASNGGWTVAGSEPYLVAQADPYEGTSPDYYDWSRSIATRQLERVLGLRDLARLQVVERDGRGPRGGRVVTVTATGRGGDVSTLGGESFRSSLGLPSTLFEVGRVR
ncbi:SpoIID/LytB domain-containing protein [Nocardioides euryhalodurans]|nr:SpoIID/LytB domain-containing protein [Nocardioides euryhalodurans]